MCMDDFLEELVDLELDVYKATVIEYRQLVRDIANFRDKKHDLIVKEEFELLIVIRDTLRAKEPIAMELKKKILMIANVMNLMKNKCLRYHIVEYLRANYRPIPRILKNGITDLEP